VVSEAAEALIQVNLALMVYSDLRTSDALSVLEDHFEEMRRDSLLSGIYSRYRHSLQEIVDATERTEDNPKLVKLYELLSKLYSVNDARGIYNIIRRLCMSVSGHVPTGLRSLRTCRLHRPGFLTLSSPMIPNS